MDPGIMAAISAAGLLGGVNRLAVASTVIVVRILTVNLFAENNQYQVAMNPLGIVLMP
jgi:hypothetical protein